MTIEPLRAGHRRALIVAGALVLLAAPAAAQDDLARPWWAGTLITGTGVEYSSGDFRDDTSTDIWDVPFSVRYIFEEIGLTPLDEIEFKVSIPYRLIREPDPDGGRENRSGIGDLDLRLGYYYVPRAKRWPILGLLGWVQLDTGTDHTGTGATDYSMAFDVSNSYELGEGRYPRITPFGRVSYRFKGNSPDYEREDTLETEVGFTFRPFRALSLGIAYDWGWSNSNRSDVQELSPFLSWRYGSHLRFGPYGVVGFSRSSVDYAAGIGIYYSLDVD